MCLVLIRIVGAVLGGLRCLVLLETVLAYLYGCLLHGELQEFIVVFVEYGIE